MSYREPCKHQGTTTPWIMEDDTPCLICAGLMSATKSNDQICPFKAREDNPNLTRFLRSVNMNHITATERTFEIQQRTKADRL